MITMDDGNDESHSYISYIHILYPVMMKEFLLADRKYPYNGADQANKKKMVHRNVFITNIPAFFCSVKNGENT